MDSRGVIEFRYPDGRVVNDDYEAVTERHHLGQGDTVEFDGTAWMVYDREDRHGVTFFLCRPSEGPAQPP